MSAGLDRMAVATGLVAAFLIHGAAIGLWLRADSQRPGAAARETIAVSLNLVETVVIEEAAAEPEAARQAPDLPAAAKPAPSVPAPKKAAVEPDAAPDPKPAERDPPADAPARKPPATTVPDAAEIPDRAPDQPQAVPREAPKAARPAPPLPERAERRPDRDEPRHRKIRRKQAAPSAPSAPARSKSKRAARGPAISASPGQVRNYAALVRARIARHRPRSAPGAGTVVVAFALSRNGALRYARLARSSGNGALDSAALASVRAAAPFPAPPGAMTSRQLSFVLPFHFR